MSEFQLTPDKARPRSSQDLPDCLELIVKRVDTRDHVTYTSEPLSDWLKRNKRRIVPDSYGGSE